MTWCKSACTGPGQRVIEVTRGQDVRDTVGASSPTWSCSTCRSPTWAGSRSSIDLRLEGSAGRIPDVSILLLLDREADRFLAKRADADAELVKPVDPATLRRTIDGLLAPGSPASTTTRATPIRPGNRNRSRAKLAAPFGM